MSPNAPAAAAASAPKKRKQKCTKFWCYCSTCPASGWIRTKVWQHFPSTHPPDPTDQFLSRLHHSQMEAKVSQKNLWQARQEINQFIKITLIGAWPDHISAVGNTFSVQNEQILLDCDVGLFWGKFGESKVSSPLSAICSGCHNGFVRLWILYLSAGKVCIFGSKFLPSWCGSGTSLRVYCPLSEISTEEEAGLPQWGDVKWLLGAP